jgi:hypothetical protein
MFLKQASTHIAVETERKILVHILDTLSDIVCGKQKKNYQRATKFILDYTLYTVVREHTWCPPKNWTLFDFM